MTGLLLHCVTPSTGYAQSKWMAESLAVQAGEAGLPIAVLRLPFVSGHTETGVYAHGATSNTLCALHVTVNNDCACLHSEDSHSSHTCGAP